MSGEEMYELLKLRDDEISVLRGYVKALEQALVEKRVDEAEYGARAKAWEEEIRDLRYEHGLRSDGRVRG